MGSAFKRKVYGKVRPVPKVKPKAPDRPKVQDLRSIYTQMQKATERELPDFLGQALTWWHVATPWFNFKFRKEMPLISARAFQSAIQAMNKAHASNVAKTKVKYMLDALSAFRKFAVPVLKVPDTKEYLKGVKETTKKFAVADGNVAHKYDMIVNMLMQCFPSSKMQLVPVLRIPKADGARIDHELGKIYYTRDRCKMMQEVFRKEGLLMLVVQEAHLIARANSMTQVGGTFLVDEDKVFLKYRLLLEDFAEFAATEKAPRTLVRRKIKKPKVKISDGPDPIWPGNKKKSVLDQVTDEEVKDFMANVPVYKGRQAESTEATGPVSV